MSFENLMNFFLGTPPEGFELLNYTFRCVIGIILFDTLMDLFRMLKYLGLGRR